MAGSDLHSEWLSLLEISGPFLSLPVLDRAFPQGLDGVAAELRQELRLTYSEWATSQRDPAIHQAWVRWVLRRLLQHPEAVIARPEGALAALAVAVPEQRETLAPDLLIFEPGRDRPRVLLLIVPPGQSLDRPPPGARWKEPLTTRMMTLLHGSGVRLGLLTNGEQWMLVDAPKGETTGFVTWHAQLWLEEPLTLRAFVSLLGAHMLFGRPERESLEALLAASASDQQDITDQLGLQVRQAVELLVAAVDAADRERGGALAAAIQGDPAFARRSVEEVLYEAALTVMMRLVFLLSAEERGVLLPEDEVYVGNYAVSALLPELQALATHGEELLERRHDAWVRLLATFRAIHGGIVTPTLRLPAYGGGLFDPERFPFLEGRRRGEPLELARPLPVSNRVVLHMLRSLQLLRVRGGEARRLSFRALGVEDIGHVYESLLDHTARRAAAPILGLAGAGGNEPEIALVELEEFLTQRRSGAEPQSEENIKDSASSRLSAFALETLIPFLREQTGRSESALRRALAAPVDPALHGRLRAACGGDEALLARVLPFVGLVREDSFGRPVVIPAGAVYVTQGAERRKTGTHYTPTSLTEPIVRHTLEPVVYRGPAEGKPREEWALIPLSALLQVKVLDMAMGSGAFLVQSCRYLAARLAEAVEAQVGASESAPPGVDGDAWMVLREIRAAEGEEREALARRLIAERCLYGVDKNPLAVEMAKLSLWLLLLDQRRPFSFLDHALRSGDSLLGISDIEQLYHWSLRRAEVDGQQVGQYHLIQRQVEAALERALALRWRIRSEQVRPERKAAWLREAEQTMALVRLGADLLVAAALHPDKGARQSLLTRWGTDYSLLLSAASDTRDGRFAGDGRTAAENRTAHAALGREADALLAGRQPFHWPLELPEVFLEERREAPGTQLMLDAFAGDLAPLFADGQGGVAASDSPGFSAIVGNPPFIGGRRVRESLGDAYREALYEVYPGSSGNADLSAFFFLRGFSMLHHGGTLGLIATNTIAQGDTRQTGLDTIINTGGVIYRAENNKPWPGLAAVVVSIVHIYSGFIQGLKVLDAQTVENISSQLEGNSVTGKPFPLLANKGVSHMGTNVVGTGFILEKDEANALFARSEKNKDVIFPFINGQDLNSSPDQSPSRFIINFFDWPLERAQEYSDCFHIIQDRVYPERVNSGGGYAKYWWLFGRRQERLYAAIRDLKRVLIVAQTSKTLAFCFVAKGMVYSHATIVIASEKSSILAILQSNFHVFWVLQYASSLKGDARYIPTDCFETFPFPACLQPGSEGSAESYKLTADSLTSIGERYHAHRQAIMLQRQEGLTKTYNRFHNPGETSADIAELRRLHVEMDSAVAAAYGWSDLDLGHGFHETKQGLRYTISEAARRTVLDRLLALNHERYAEEERAGMHGKGARKAAKPQRRGKEQPQAQSENPKQQELF